MRRIYMDHSATTPVRPEVVEAMMPYFTEKYGNASSVHTIGQEAHNALEESRQTVATLLGASPEEIVFTSGGTESDNMAIKGVAAALREKGRHIITCAIEHHAVLNTVSYLEKHGYEVTRLGVDHTGLVDPEALARAVRPDTILVSIMLANNEVGTIEPIAELAAAARKAAGRRVLFHTDAVQAVGKIPVNVQELGVDLMAISGHKFYSPKGVGVLYVRAGTRMEPMQFGGHHERGRRAGTENVSGIVGLAKALELACAERDQEAARLSALRDRIHEGLLAAVEDSMCNGHPKNRLPHLVNLSFKNVEGESLLLSLDALGIAVSTGSACSSGTLEPSHVLMAMGIPAEIAHGSLRFSLGRITTAEDVDYVLEKVPPVIERLRQMSPFATKEFSA
jgi:cysteine desulfurase